MTATFAYRVRDRAGRIVEGELEAADEQLVAAKLRQMGYVPVRITRRSRSALTTDIRIRSDRMRPKDLVVFSRQLATMINAGLPLLRALNILAEQTASRGLTKVIDEVRADVERGLSFSQAIARHPKVFPPLYLALIRAGETGGTLDSVMVRLADTLEKQQELRGKIRSAMTYPIAVAVLVVVILSAMLVFIVPMFKGMYDDLGGTLPLPTRVLMAVSDAVTSRWYIVAGFVIAAFVAFRRWVATDSGRLRWDAAKLRAPVFGSLIHKTALARMTRTLSSMLRSGVPVLESFDIVAATAGNAVVSAAVIEARDRIRLGEALAPSLGASPVIPAMVTHMIAVGEETGAIDSMLAKIADFYDREVESTVESLTSLIEPMLMVLMGVTVGAMVIALYLPMFQIIDLVK